MIIGGLQSLSLCDYPGRPAAVLFTQGCNFRCPFCHNPGLFAAAPVGPPIDCDDLLAHLERRRQLVDAVVVSGGEPTLHPDLPEFLAELRRLRLAIKLDTNGSRPAMVEALVDRNLVDFIAMDVKAPFELYDRLAGVSVSREAIRSSIRLIAESGIDHLFRTTFATSHLTESDLDQIRSFLPRHSRYVIQGLSSPLSG